MPDWLKNEKFDKYKWFHVSLAIMQMAVVHSSPLRRDDKWFHHFKHSKSSPGEKKCSMNWDVCLIWFQSKQFNVSANTFECFIIEAWLGALHVCNDLHLFIQLNKAVKGARSLTEAWMCERDRPRAIETVCIECMCFCFGRKEATANRHKNEAKFEIRNQNLSRILWLMKSRWATIQRTPKFSDVCMFNCQPNHISM